MGDKKSEVEDLVRTISDVNAEPIKIPYAVIKSITKNFAQVIGTGGFGMVYLGMLKHEDLQNGMVAVKKVSTWNSFTEKLFLNEIICLTKLRHENIVRFLGYCADTHGEVWEKDGEFHIAEEQYMFLCFEYIPNGDLEHYLKEKPPHGYEWNMGYHIIQGICRGLDYLAKNGISHQDLKPANVLLGVGMVPKIIDFGLSRHIDENQSKIWTRNIQGTLGYIAPETIDNGQISLKSDIYSLGIIMIKLLTGSSKDHTEDWYKSLDGDCHLMNICIEIAQNCVDHNPCKRPTAREVILKLNEAEAAIQNVALAVNKEPRNDPMSSLYQNVQRFLSVPSRALCEHYRTIDLYDDLDALERILVGTEKPSSIPYPLLQFITNNFKRRIVHNDFGELFKGILQVVAVIRLSRSLNIIDRKFHQGVELMKMAQHENIVRFLGSCSNAEKEVENDGKITSAELWDRLLCFEHFRKGSLEYYLSDELRGLQWKTRYLIIKGICKGLSYIHEEMAITYMDLKPSSILLDDSMVPKITGFGLSTFKSNKRGQQPGYSAPELMVDGLVSPKTDIYSLGVIILELVTGSKEKPNITNVLRRWKHRWMKSLKQTPIDEQHQVSFAKEYHQVCECTKLALRCQDQEPKRRPSIRLIIRELNELDNDADVFTFDQISARLEPMLGIEPLELHFPFELSNGISRSVELTNDTDSHFAFTIAPSSSLPYRTQPNKGVVPPRYKCSVTITLQPLEMAPPPCKHGSYKFYVLSTRVDESLRAEDITDDLFDEDYGKVVDKLDLNIIVKSKAQKSVRRK